MNYSQVITNPIQQAILAILLVSAGFSTGYTVSDHQGTPEAQAVIIEEQLRDFDQFSYKAQEVDAMMQDVISNPTETNMRMANNKLKINYANWEHREYGENKELFSEYRIACQVVIDDMQSGKLADTTEMNLLYNELVPTTNEIHKEPLKISNSYPFLWLTNSIVPMNY